MLKMFNVLMMVVFISSCSSGPKVKSQDYAKLRETWTYEHEFSQVWRGIEYALRQHKVAERDPEKATAKEMKNLQERTLKTDWIYAKSRDKYIEYEINDI